MNWLFERELREQINLICKNDFPMYDNVFLCGSRKSGKTRVGHETINTVLSSDIKADAYWLRGNREGGADESYKEFKDKWKEKYNLTSNEKKLLLSFQNNNEIHFLNVNTNFTLKSQSANSGIAMKNDRDYIIVFVEEAQQINIQQLINTFNSLRSNAETKFAFYFIMNPTDSSSEAVKWAEEICKPVLSVLKEKGFIMGKRKTYDRTFDTHTRELCIWNNFKTCKDEKGNWLISEGERRTLAQIIKFNPVKAICDVWGFPFSLGGKSYLWVNSAIFKEKFFRKGIHLFAGCDFADGRTKQSAVNGFVAGTEYNECEEVDCCAIYDQREGNPEGNINSLDCIGKFFLNQAENYRQGYIDKTGDEDIEMTCYIDYKAVSLINWLQEHNANDNISFEKCQKFEKKGGSNGADLTINERVNVEDFLFKIKKLRIWEGCKDLIEQLLQCQKSFDKYNKQKVVARWDKFNDLIDALDYFLSFRFQNYLNKETI